MTAHSEPPAASTAGAFDQSHPGRMRSTTVEAIYRSAFGADYPAAAQPSAFYSATTLRMVAGALDLRPGRVLADLGCGHGGPGLWAAQQTGATLIGIDLSPAGIELARRRAAQLGLAARARFTAGDLTATGLPDASCDAVMSLDVLPFVPGKAAAVREVARILRPGGRFAFTTWEQLTHPATSDDDDPQRQALAATFRGPPSAIRPGQLPPAHRASPAYRRDIPGTTRVAAPAAGPRRRHHRRRIRHHRRHGRPLPSHGPGLPHQPAQRPLHPRRRTPPGTHAPIAPASTAHSEFSSRL
jgi:SAM-dependent methyltransferase